VLFTCLHASVAGSSRSLATLLAHLPADYRRVVAAPRGAFTAFVSERQLAEEFVTIRSPGRIRTLTRVAASLSLGKWIIVHGRSIAAVHANGLADFGIVWPGAWLAGVPVVVWSHKPGAVAPRTRRSALVGRWLVRRLRWVAASVVALETLVDGGFTERERIEIIENPIDPADVVAPRVCADGVTVGFLGDASWRKGFQFLPDIVTRVGQEQVRWLIFARPRANGELAEAWRAVDTMPNVHVVGRELDVRAAYSQCDIVICPSLNESFCRVAAEAMTNGIAVVASDLPALKDLVGDGRAGLLFPIGDVNAAADAVRLLVCDPALRERLGRSGRESASHYDPRVTAARFAEVYATASHGAFE
jgi:glycosyltransferase involved in cell wall biosynthesis